MRSHLLSLLTGLSVASMTTFAEPPVQAGETLESLSKVKVSTTVNGQPGSLNELIASGQIKPVQAVDTATSVNGTVTEVDPNKAAVDPNPVADATTDAPAAQPVPAQATDAELQAPQAEPAANQ